MQQPIDSNILIDLWKRGYSLSRAGERFADLALQEQEQGKAQELIDNPDKTLEGLPAMDTLTEGFASVMTEAVKILRPIATHNEARWALEKDVQRQLIKNELLGIGYCMPRSPSSAPDVIPADAWTGKVDWAKGTLEGGGMSFVQVRVILEKQLEWALRPKSKNDLFSPEPSPPKINAPKVGRPTVQKEIFDAFGKLTAEGLIDFSGSMRSHFDLIRDRMGKDNPDHAGQFRALADETIRKEISADFKKLKGSKKQ